jgi:enoyl-CoA hydratase/carnithine racemase
MTAAVAMQTVNGVMTVSLNRPAKRNALTDQMLAELRTTLTGSAGSGIHAVILTGAGGCFSAGADIAELTGTTGDIAFDDGLSEIAAALQDGPFLSIAAVEGPCVGAGFDLACACDARVVSKSSFFELPAVKLGLLYNPSSIARLHAMLPGATLRHLLLLGEKVQGRDALAAGVATIVVEDGQTLTVAQALAQRATASSRTLIETKRLVAALDRGDADLAPWQAIRADILGSPERQAALKLAKSKLQR